LRKKIGITDRQLKNIRACYAGECTMVDTWVGELLGTVERLGIDDDTAVIFTTDHGIYLDYPGDGGRICKPHSVHEGGIWHMSGPKWRTEPSRRFVMAPSLTNTPLMLHLPGQGKGRRIKGFAQALDLMPTVLELFGAPRPAGLQGQSLLRATKAGACRGRDHVTCGYEGSHLAQIMNRRWLYAAWKEGRQAPVLFDRRKDPLLKRNVASQNPAVATKLRRQLMKDLEASGADEKELGTFA
jgi:arylsulfatase A-like enzyme